MDRETDRAMLIGGTGGVYFLAPRGDLVVEVYRHDRNPDDGLTPMRAILFAPDRSVIAEEWIQGAADAVGSARFQTRVTHPGVYGLNVMFSGDRYGGTAYWGFRTNCPKYLVETSRGHRDARHQEPIVLANPAIDGAICFMPRQEAIALEASGIPPASPDLSLVDAAGNVLQTLKVAEDGTVSATIPADVPREAVPWRLQTPRFKGVFNIDGVTRWSRGEAYANLSLWTPDAEAWFNFYDYRWLLTPYHRTVYGAPGSTQRLSFDVHNQGRRPVDVSLSLDADDEGGPEPVLSAASVSLGPGATESVQLTLTVPSARGERLWRLRATPSGATDMTTFSTILVRAGTAPAEKPLDMPIVLKPYQHENRQFGYLPQYPTGNQLYFGMDNAPYVLADSSLHRRGADGWDAVPLRISRGDQAGQEARQRSTKIAFDAGNTLYTIGTAGSEALLLASSDHGRTFQSAAIPGGGTVDIEQFSGQNLPQSPPPLVRFKRTKKDPKLKWRSLNDLDLFLPAYDGDALTVGEPITLSRKCIGLSAHSGIPSTIVSRGDRVHIAWGEATDPEDDAPGVPTFVVTYQRGQGLLGEPLLVGYGPPANDGHNSPCITMDSKGFLHVLVGTHGRTFKYARSLEPNTAQAGWTEAVDVGPGLRQTYVGLVCDKQDNLHLVFRLWQGGKPYFPAGSYAQLAHMVKPAGQPWSEPRPLVIAPFSEYSIYYHRLTIDRRGRLFLSYDYWSTFWFYRTDHRGDRRAVIMSDDAGSTWRLAADSDLAP